MNAYYNEIDSYAADWLENLILLGHIAPGIVDRRSITDVDASDLRGFSQCHFFAGIGGWSIALRLAGWPDDYPVWTGSCPCQPFSVAGKGKAQKDERHLWPSWFSLIAERKPSIIFGEQVAGDIAHGWWDDAADDLERENYETGAAVLPACSVGAPHRRDRLWFVADCAGSGRRERHTQLGRVSKGAGVSEERRRFANGSKIMANANTRDYKDGTSRKLPQCAREWLTGEGNPSMENADCRGQRRQGICTEQPGRAETVGTSKNERCGFWQSEPAVGRVANGIPARAHKLRAYGNAIVPQVAAGFIKSFMEINHGYDN